MELKLVYRALRQISEWTVAGYYNEVRVEGAENVPADAPLIIAARHPNEIIDVAAITITIPYRRHLSFWAKSPLFSWAIMRAILLSSGAIPVLRMPNKPTDKESSDPGVRQAASTRQTALFASTSAALDAGAAVAVFPEGTTCTEPGMPLLREGAVWAAVEFVKWADRKRYKGEDVLIIPVGITYTDKMVLKSNVIITYAPSIRITDYYKPGIEESRVVKEVTAELERRLLQVTANARDWDTYHAAQMARDILWDDASRIELDKYVPVMQTLYDLFDPSNATEPQQCAKDALIQYYSLTHHASIPHRALSAIYPSPAPPAVSRGSALLSLLRTGIRTLSPWTLAFIPPFLLHLPAYVLSPLAGRLLPKHREDEAVAQWRAVAGGVGMAVGWGIWGCVGWRRFGLRRIVDRLMLGRGQKAVLLVAATYLAAHIMARWHNALIDYNYRHVERLQAAFKVLVGSMTSPSNDAAPPPPPSPLDSPHVRRRPAPSYPSGAAPRIVATPANAPRDPPSPPTRQLIRPLLKTRSEAEAALSAFLETADEERVALLKAAGATIRYRHR